MARGYRVFAIEPNADMRRMTESRLAQNADFSSINGTDCNTTLPDSSVDFVSAAQAFHWFFKKECKRILKPGGKVIIVYNSRVTEAECNIAPAELYREFCPDFKGFSNGINDKACKEFFGNGCDIFKCDNSLVYDCAGYINRCLSSSYSHSRSIVT